MAAGVGHADQPGGAINHATEIISGWPDVAYCEATQTAKRFLLGGSSVAAMKTKRLRRNFVCVLAAGALLVACGQSDNLESESDEVEATAMPTEDVPDAPDPTPTDEGDGTPDGLCDPYADYAGTDGTVVTIVGSIAPVEQQLFEDSWAEFEECTGIDISYEGREQRAA